MDVVPYDKSFIRSKFECEEPSLSEYLQKYISQDIKKSVAQGFVIVENNIILGYYTLSSSSIPRNHLTDRLQKKYGYQDLPVTLLGRLARDKKSKGQGLGSKLMIDAMKRTYEASLEIGSIAMIVDPINQYAIKFYEQFDFVLLDSGKMILPMATIKPLYDGEG